MTRLFVAALLLVGTCGTALSQTVRFETNVGNFDMVLNPDDDPNLQPLVDNLIAYVGLGRYHFTAINRAADNNNTNPSDDFVLQLGGFMGFQPTPELWPQLFEAVDKLPEAIVDEDGDGEVDFNSITNSRGTVSLALAAGDVNSGTSSFFINLGNNSFLDSQGFVPFAEITNMSTIDTIMELDQQDLSSAVGQPGSLAFVDVPITEEQKLVIVQRAYVVEADEDFSFVGPIATLLQLQNRDNLNAANSLLSSSLSASDSLTELGLSSTAVPEPATAWLLAPLALWGAARLRRS
jgi:peptidyl-prolyl cis-trans isomerase A (cyclophilin A)